MLFASPALSHPFYLDPGSGSILIQMIVAALLGGGIILRTQWKRIKKWFGGRIEEPDEDKDDEENIGQ